MGEFEVWLVDRFNSEYDEFVGDYASLDEAIVVADLYKSNHTTVVMNGITGGEVYRA